jgi:hypothetical protein
MIKVMKRAKFSVRTEDVRFRKMEESSLPARHKRQVKLPKLKFLEKKDEKPKSA